MSPVIQFGITNQEPGKLTATILTWPLGATAAWMGSALDQLMAANGFTLWANVRGSITWRRDDDRVRGTIEVEMSPDPRADVEYDWIVRVRPHGDDEGPDHHDRCSTPEKAIERCLWAMRVTGRGNGGTGRK